MTEALIAAYVLCSMIGYGILAYRDAANEPGEVIGLLLFAPLGLAYQSGALIRDIRKYR